MQSNNSDEQQGICWIDQLPAELLLKIFERMDWQLRLKMEIISKKWNLMLKEKNAWSHFTQCRLTNAYSPQKVHTLFTRCDESLRELIITGPKPTDENVATLADASEIFAMCHLLPRMDTLYLANRPLTDKCPIHAESLGRLRCLHLDNCFVSKRLLRESQERSVAVRLALEASKTLRYLSITTSSRHMPGINCDSFQPSGAACFHELRHVRLDDRCHYFGDWIVLLCRPEVFPKLIGLSFSYHFMAFVFRTNANVELLFNRLHLFEMSLASKQSEYNQQDLINFSGQIVPSLRNVRILSLAHINGEILKSIVHHCPHIEQLEYQSHQASVLDAFPALGQLKQLRVLRVLHYDDARPKPAISPQMAETLRELANAARLEHLSLNFKLPLELMLHIVHKCPRLSFLEVPLLVFIDQNFLDSLSLALDKVANIRQKAPLHLGITCGNFLRNKEALAAMGKSQQPKSAFLKLRHGPPNEASRVMRGYWVRVFEGSGDVPKFLLHWPEPEETG